MFEPMDGSTIATVTSVALAAIAAIASWASVRLNRRQWLLAQQPILSAQMERQGSGEVHLLILNAGAGPARGVRFCVAVGDKFVSGFAGPQYGGYLRPGDRAVVVLELEAGRGEQANGVVMCWDAIGRVHRFTMHGEHKVLRQRRGVTEQMTDPQAAYRELYGGGALDGLDRVGGRGQRPPAPA